jgi:hypothetical protein
MTSPSEYKQCPDCAEHVLAAARKCRYCGYRFEPIGNEGPTLASLFGFRRTPRGGTLPDVLAAWGLGLRNEEEVGLFLLANVDERSGYVLVTNERFVFFAQTARGKHVRVLEHQLSDISEVSVVGGRLRRRLELRGPEFSHVVQGAARPSIERLGEYLAVHGNSARPWKS